MNKTLSVLIALALFSMLTPGAHATETVTEPYRGTAGFDLLGERAAFVICPASCDFNDLCLDDDDPTTCAPNTGLIPVIDPVGGTRLYASTFYTNVIITPSDDFYGSGAGIATCFWNPDGDNTCNPEEDYPSETTCGTVALLNSPFAGDFVTAWVFTIVVTADLETCGGTLGTMTADFF